MCEAAALYEGGLRLHGHGRQERSLRGPQDVADDSVWRVVWFPRDRCVVCGAVCTVLPRGIV